MPYIVAVTWRAKPGATERVEAILRELATLSSREPGCVHFYVDRSVNDPNEFLLYEVYDDEAAFDAHQATEYYKRLVPGEALALLAERVRKNYRRL